MKLLSIAFFLISLSCFGQNGLQIEREVKPEHEKCKVDVQIKDHDKDIAIAKQFKSKELLLASGGVRVPFEYYAQGHIVVELNHPKALKNIYFNPIGNKEVRKRIYKVRYTHEYLRVYDAKCVIEMISKNQ